MKPSCRVRDLTGQRFERVRVLSFAGIGRHRKALWECVCDCGQTTVIPGQSLVNGHTRSCGCLHQEIRRSVARSHGRSRTKEYQTWRGMLSRCHNPRDGNYRHYGARGISVCPEWRSSFARFFEEMGERPTIAHSIDRIDNDGDYEPGNCRWATRDQQLSNTSRNVRLSFMGENLTVTQWAIKLKLNQQTLANRIRRGMPVERALTLRPRGEASRVG